MHVHRRHLGSQARSRHAGRMPAVHRGSGLLLGLLWIGLLGGCRSPGGQTANQAANQATEQAAMQASQTGALASLVAAMHGEPTARLPAPPGPFGPAHTTVAAAGADQAPSGATFGQELTDVDSCGSCHPDAAAQWATSAHAFASFSNPVYRVSIEGFRAGAGKQASRFCGGCHDVALLVDGALDSEIATSDARAHAGVSCRVCHGIAEVTLDGNGSFRLRAEPIPLPSEGDPESLTRHRKAVARSPLGNTLCMSCHRSFLGRDTGNEQHLTGMDEATAWQSSAYAGQGTARIDHGVPRRDCIGCHMQREAAPEGDMAAKDGQIASHRFLGGHTWLAAMRNDPSGVERVQAFMRDMVSVDVAAAIDLATGARSLPADGAVIRPGMRLGLDVVIRNRGVGHRFPGGVLDAQDTWIEVEVRDERGALVAASGLGHERDAADSEAHVLRSLMADEHGQPLFEREVHAFRSGIVNHTIGPRDVAVVRYVLEVPDGVAGPLSVTARVQHRTRNLRLQEAACQASHTPEGQEFGRTSQVERGAVLDACTPQPVTTVAQSKVWLGAGSQPGSAALSPSLPAWQRLYEHGLGWLHGLQEHLDEARPSLLAALERLPADAPDRERAAILVALGRLAGRQGRTDEALDWLAQAEALQPGHTAIAAARGAALAQVWRWQEAEAPLSQAAEKAPGNVQAWADLAMALGSLGKDREALAAAHNGLALSPRDEALLRVQAVALQTLRAGQAAQALEAYDRFRPPDRATDIRFACAARDPMCNRERQPVHEHVLQPMRPTAGRASK